jgi:hypothetical protein
MAKILLPYPAGVTGSGAPGQKILRGNPGVLRVNWVAWKLKGQATRRQYQGKET